MKDSMIDATSSSYRVRSPAENPYLMTCPPDIKDLSFNSLHLKVAETIEEVEEAQRLRYQVFYQEMGATPVKDMALLKRDYDEFDDVSTHLLVVDKSTPNKEKVIGTYRMFRQDVSDDMIPFYTETEFDIGHLKNKTNSLMEVGRSCILDGYRTRFALQLLWQGIASFIFHYKIDCLFGCVSFEGTSLQENALALSYLYHFHLAREDIRSKTLPHLHHDIDLIPKENIDEKEALKLLPPLVKGYLRLGGKIGDGAMIDEQFDTVDVCIMVERTSVGQRYVDYYRRDRSEKNELS